MTCACVNAALICCSTGTNRPAQRAIKSQTVPSLIWTPSRSLITSHARARGSNCCSTRYTAIALTVAPYCRGACTPAGKAALVMCWQSGQCFCSARYSRTTRRGDGRSTTWRRSPPHAATACRSCWHASHLSTCCSITSSGVNDHDKLEPGCPGCPPDFFSLFLRQLFGVRTKRSEDGGRWLLWLSFASRSCKAFSCSLKLLICSPWCWIKAFCSDSNACCCWIVSSRCVSCSRSTVFSSRREISSSSIVMLLLYWV